MAARKSSKRSFGPPPEGDPVAAARGLARWADRIAELLDAFTGRPRDHLLGQLDEVLMFMRGSSRQLEQLLATVDESAKALVAGAISKDRAAEDALESLAGGGYLALSDVERIDRVALRDAIDLWNSPVRGARTNRFKSLARAIADTGFKHKWESIRSAESDRRTRRVKPSGRRKKQRPKT